MSGTGGMCYVAAMGAISEIMSGGVPRKNIRLCHGDVVSGKSGTECFSHAWVEVKHQKNWIAIDASTVEIGEAPIMIDRDEYRRIFEVKNLKQYTCDLAQALFKKTNHYGPWD